MDLQLGLFDDLPARAVRPVGPVPHGDDVLDIARRIPAGLRLGTSSWSFPGWAGIVYDRAASEAVLARHGLEAYAAHPLLRTVGLDRTWYRPIPAEHFRSLADAVGDDFRFLVKADRVVTSAVDPGGLGVRGPNPLFLNAHHAEREVVEPMLEGLDAKAGPLLFQFPPTPPNLVGGRDRFAELLHAFLEALPDGPVYAVELRSPALLSTAYVQALQETGTAHCFNVHPAMTPLKEQLDLLQPHRQPLLVVRWMLHAGLRYEAAKDRYEPFDRIVDEDVESRELITVAVFDALLAERAAFVVVNNKAEGSAPLSVLKLAERIAGWEGTSAIAAPEPGRPHLSPPDGSAISG